MAIKYPVNLAITLTPKLSNIAPEVTVRVPGQNVYKTLQNTTRVDFEFTAPSGWVEVEFANKPADDADLAVIIDSVEFFGISDPKFVWTGIYTPRYPELWYSQQIEKPLAHIPQQNYMGWNGTWRLEFTVPVFTWIHRTLDFGWMYQ